MSARVIRVDWEAWAVAEAGARTACGWRSFVPESHRALAESVVERVVARAVVKEMPHNQAEDGAMLPGVAAWLANRSRPL